MSLKRQSVLKQCERENGSRLIPTRGTSSASEGDLLRTDGGVAEVAALLESSRAVESTRKSQSLSQVWPLLMNLSHMNN